VLERVSGGNKNTGGENPKTVSKLGRSFITLKVCHLLAGVGKPFPRNDSGQPRHLTGQHAEKKQRGNSLGSRKEDPLKLRKKK